MNEDQQVRAAAVQAAATLYGNLQAGKVSAGVVPNKDAALTALYIAAKFEEYIKTGNSAPS
ncbi:hypothetical protein ACFWOX_04770 [Streptomyces sp. NPDC058467]|uniref:hypothetical protein n=1 Tax=Streptomyces sp. NPDC058467 TaxID=3346513 RepID=UPI0036553EA7